MLAIIKVHSRKVEIGSVHLVTNCHCDFGVSLVRLQKSTYEDKRSRHQSVAKSSKKDIESSHL